MSDPEPTERQVRVRRGPRVLRFLAVGAGLGAVAALIDIGVTPKDADYSTAQALGFIALVLVPIGAALGGVLAVLLDRLSIRRSRIVMAERTRGRASAPAAAPAPAGVEQEQEQGPTAGSGEAAQDGGVDRGP